MRTCIHAYLCTCILSTCIQTYIHLYIYTYLCTYIRTYIHNYLHACMHTLFKDCKGDSWFRKLSKEILTVAKKFMLIQTLICRILSAN